MEESLNNRIQQQLKRIRILEESLDKYEKQNLDSDRSTEK
jgi:hypothetical protein